MAIDPYLVLNDVSYATNNLQSLLRESSSGMRDLSEQRRLEDSVILKLDNVLNEHENLLLQNVAKNKINEYYSDFERSIILANRPIEISETEEITVNGQTGIWSNKNEVLNWRGLYPISEYEINQDESPEIIRKSSDQNLVYEQELAVRYLRPPTPPAPGEIIIKQEKNIFTPPAPPLVLRQQPPRSETPAPLVIREAPPKPPAQIGKKIITISGKRFPPPPRKVIVERLAPLPPKPQSIILERWLPYAERKRRVIYVKDQEPDPIFQKPKNVIVQWEPPKVTTKRVIKDLGVVRANPVDYVQKYGSELRDSTKIPDLVKDIRPSGGLKLAAEYTPPSALELIGDLDALKLVDLDREGLSEYKSYVSSAQTTILKGTDSNSNFGNTSSTSSTTDFGTSSSLHRISDYNNYYNNYSVLSSSNINANSARNAERADYVTTATGSNNFGTSGYVDNSQKGGSLSKRVKFSLYSDADEHSTIYTPSNTSNIELNNLILDLFSKIKRDQTGRVLTEEAEKIVLKLNNRLSRGHNEKEIKDFFVALDKNKDGVIQYEEFRSALIKFLDI